MSEPIKVYRAKKIRTMSRNMPIATHVAVKDGKILAVGDAATCAAWGEIEIDDRFADKVLMPGFVEAHAHAQEGTIWKDIFLGFFPRYSPEGSLEGGLKSIEAVVERLQQAEAEMTDPDEPLTAWGFDPIYYDRRMTRADLDRVSTTRPVLVMHASLHILNANTKTLDMANMFEVTGVDGIHRDASGDITGELQEMAAMFLATEATGAGFKLGGATGDALRRYAQSAVNAGVTTSTDLAAAMPDADVAVYQAATEAEDFPMRLVPALYSAAWDIAPGVEQALKIRDQGNDKLHFGIVKVMTDGSIQGFTGRLKWPGYYNGAPNGIWNFPPARLKEMIKSYHAAGLHVHIHVNGDQASEYALECLEEALTEHPRPDHRHTLQHCQMADEAQFRKMAELGVCVNLFANHIFYWGDQHEALTMGPDRARRMDACATALAAGVPLSLHCDAPVTPLGPLFSAWAAVNRLTSTGRVLGPEERISVADALHAVTLGAAHELKLDHLVGSIEVGKFADFAVLAEDPMEVAPEALKDIYVHGTVVAGVPFDSKIAAPEA